MHRMPTSVMTDRIRKVGNINEQKYDLTDKERLHNALVEYSFFAKKVIAQMKQLKKAVEAYRNIKRQSITNYKVFLQLVDKYEETNLN